MTETAESQEFYAKLDLLYPRLRVEVMKLSLEIAAETSNLEEAGAIAMATAKILTRMDKQFVTSVPSVPRTRGHQKLSNQREVE